MFTERRDFLIDEIQRLMQAVARLLARARDEPMEFAQLERDCERAMDDEFAELDRQMKGLEPRMVAHLCRPVARLRAYALLLSARTVLHSRREEQDADLEPQARRALSLVLEAGMASDPVPADLDAIRALFPLVDDGQLSPRYLQALVDLSPPG